MCQDARKCAREGAETGGSRPAVQGLTWAGGGGSQPALLMGLQSVVRHRPGEGEGPE